MAQSFWIRVTKTNSENIFRFKSLKRGCLSEKNVSATARSTERLRSARMILTFAYMKIFVPVYKDKYVTWYSFDFSIAWFNLI